MVIPLSTGGLSVVGGTNTRDDIVSRIAEIEKMPHHYDMHGHQPGCGVCGTLRELRSVLNRMDYPPEVYGGYGHPPPEIKEALAEMQRRIEKSRAERQSSSAIIKHGIDGSR